MLVADHDMVTLLYTPFPIISIFGTNCCCNVILFYMLEINDIVLCTTYCIVLYCIVLY